jgi:hypothetical protein
VASGGKQLGRMLCLEGITVVGEAGAVALAQGVRQAGDASQGLAILEDEPGGPWVAVASDKSVDTRRLRFRGRDGRARIWTTTLALEFIRRLLLGLADGWAQ